MPRAHVQLAIRTDRLSALIMGGFPPLNGPYADMLRITLAGDALSRAQSSPAPGESDTPNQESQWSSTALSKDQARQFLTLYQALQGFDDRAAQTRITCPRLCFVGSGDEMRYPPAWGGVHVSMAGPIVAGQAHLEDLGWDVYVLDGLDHMQAMLPTQVLPILRPWLASKLAPEHLHRASASVRRRTL